MVQRVDKNLRENDVMGVLREAQQLTTRQLLELTHQVEDAVARGTAQMQDYEVFVRCKRELMEREFRHST